MRVRVSVSASKGREEGKHAPGNSQTVLRPSTAQLLQGGEERGKWVKVKRGKRREKSQAARAPCQRARPVSEVSRRRGAVSAED